MKKAENIDILLALNEIGPKFTKFELLVKLASYGITMDSHILDVYINSYSYLKDGERFVTMFLRKRESILRKFGFLHSPLLTDEDEETLRRMGKPYARD